MELQAEQVEDVAVVRVGAEYLDASNSKEFRDRLGGALKGAAKAVLDLTPVQFMDSSGCGALLACLKQLRQSGGEMKVCGLSRPVRAFFDMVRMERILGVHPNRDEALQAFGVAKG
jgi:anti-sigma B factor antagonist